MRQAPVWPRLRPYLLLVLLSAALFVPGQAGLPPFDRDESRYLQATAQMFETGNFVDIRFQDQPRYLQPAGIYWLQAASVALFSEPGAREVWAHRLPSLLGATAAVLLTAWIGNLLFGAPVGFVAAVLLAASVLLGVEARMAKIDAVLLAVTLAAQAALARIYLSAAAGREAPARWAALLWLASGAGLMLKGPIILLVVLGTVLLLVVTERRAAWLRQLRPGWGVPLMLAVVLPWLVAIAIASNGDILRDRDRKKPARQGRDRPAIARRAAGLLSRRVSADLLAGIAVRRAGGAVRLGAAARAGSALLPVLDRADLDRLRAGRDQAAALRAADLSGDRLPDRGRAARAGGESGRAPGGVRDAGWAGLWLLLGVALAALLPIAAWMLEARVDWVGILTVLAVAPLLGLTLACWTKGGGCRRSRAPPARR